jgi:hypothetical protein
MTMAVTDDRLAAIARIREDVRGELNKGQKPSLLAEALFELLVKAIENGALIGSQLSRDSAAAALSTTTKTNAFKRAVVRVAQALQISRPDDPTLMPASDDREGTACVEAAIAGIPHLVFVRGPSSEHRATRPDSLLRLTAEFRPIPPQIAGTSSQVPEADLYAVEPSEAPHPADLGDANSEPSSPVTAVTTTLGPKPLPPKGASKPPNERRSTGRVGFARLRHGARKFGALLFLLLGAGCVYAAVLSIIRTPTATASKVDVVTSGGVHLQYRGFQRDGTSPVCGCKEELDPNDWWGISSLAREVSMFRSGGPPYTKYVVTGAEPKQIQWLPGLFKTRAQIFILRQPFGGEGFNPRLLSSGKMPGGYEIVTLDEVDEAFIYIITKAPLRVNLLSKVPVFAMLPMANSEITAHRTVGSYASAASRVTITENYKPWIIPPSGELDEDGPYEFPIVDFVGPDVVFWTEHSADIVTEHKAYHYPQDGGIYLMGVFVTKPPFASRVGVMPLTDAQRNEDVTTLGIKTKTPILTKGGTFQIEIPNPVDQMRDYSQIYSYARAHPSLPVDNIPLTYHTFGGPSDKPPLTLPNDFGLKNEFSYPPIPPMAGFNVFGPLSSVKVDAAQGSLSEESGASAIRLNVPSTVELLDISGINRDRGILTLPADSKETIRLNLRATGDVFVDGKKRPLSPWTQRLAGTHVVYLFSAAGFLVVAIFLALTGFGRRQIAS